jgi:hypothetical protein
MRLLFDTRVFLQYITADSRLPAPFPAVIRDRTDRAYTGRHGSEKSGSRLETVAMPVEPVLGRHLERM